MDEQNGAAGQSWSRVVIRLLRRTCSRMTDRVDLNCLNLLNSTNHGHLPPQHLTFALTCLLFSFPSPRLAQL